MDDESWANGYARSLAVFLNGAAIPEPDTRGQRIVDDSFLVLFNGHDESLRVHPAGRRLRQELARRHRHRGTGHRPRARVHPRVGGDGTGAQCGRAPLPPGAAGHVPGGCRRTASVSGMPHRPLPHRPAAGRPVPSSTYRLQIQPAFTFDDAAEQADYLAALGVSHAYLSPILQPAPGSVHGYDVIDHSRLNDEAGGRTGFDRLIERLHQHGVRAVADVVPNHMTVPSPAYLNRQWWSLLRDGRSPMYAHWFDIDWEAGGGRVLMPVLGSTLEQVLADGELAVDASGGERGDEWVLRYYDHAVPGPPRHREAGAGRARGRPVLPPGPLASGGRRAQLPAVLRRDHPRRRARRGPRGVRHHPRPAGRPREDGRTRRSADRPPRRSGRPRAATSPGWRTPPATSGSSPRRSSRATSSCPRTGAVRARRATTCCCGSGASSSTHPAASR